MIIVSLAIYIGTGVFMARNFIWFTKGPSCKKNLSYIIISLILIIIMLIMTLAPISENKSIITSGALSLYIAYMTWSSLINAYPVKCNPFLGSKASYWI